MKNLFKNSLVIVVLFTALLGNANSSLTNSKDDTRTTLTFKDVKLGNVLSVKDAFGVILYKEKMKNSGNYEKGFDLTELPDGNYFFELDKGLEIKIIPFTVESNLVYVSKLSLNKEPLEIEIYYNNSKIYFETIENTQTIRRIYNLNKNEKGTYKIVSKTEGRTFVDYVSL